jgi:hypothetical protein
MSYNHFWDFRSLQPGDTIFIPNMFCSHYKGSYIITWEDLNTVYVCDPPFECFFFHKMILTEKINKIIV